MSSPPKTKSQPYMTRLGDSMINSASMPTVRVTSHDGSSVKETHSVKVLEQDNVKHVNQYLFREKLGEGAFGEVHLAVNMRNNVEYAIKRITKQRMRRKSVAGTIVARKGLKLPPQFKKAAEDGGWDAVRREVAIMKKLSHPHVIRLVEVLDDSEADSIYIVMEHAQLGPVSQISTSKDADPLPPHKTRKYFIHLLLGLEYLHFQDIAHRDIKPDNLLLNQQDQLLIVDFGVSEIFKGSDLLRKSAGSPSFMSPEMVEIAQEGYHAKIADIWAMGVCLFVWSFGTLPFKGPTAYVTYQKIVQDNPQYPEDADPILIDLLKSLLEKNPEARANLSNIREHKWVKESGIALPSIDENCQNVIQVTHEEIQNSISSVSSAMTTLKAVKKFKQRSRALSNPNDFT
eukprot:NODE_467_length_1470_cov_96.018615_g435_i0.p1 GENE.NODE_467_length_1470_cov_96.018615_g435_i0~~NODE_467_length_1470_cov_96.018615_g435_i0.p1  ORF type:complete len:401 (+),score=61.22 NODE_467_length_1470_cov_96.018615_g435_i0:234-1436(+)